MQKNSQCIFCQIIEKTVPARFLMEHEDYVVIADINPQAPTHLLIFPTMHVASLVECADAQKLGQLLMVTKDLAQNYNLSSGFRLVINTGPDGGQTVDHLHIHVLAGRALAWPPG